MLPDTSSNISLIVLAGLLSLLPVTLLFWVYYLREREPSVPGRVMTRFFAGGMFAVLPAVLLERLAYRFSQVHPATASAFFTDFIALDSPLDLALAFVVAFGVVALIEEGVRFFVLRFLLHRSPEIDQVSDGLQVGIAAGLGFAFIENSLYFLRLFQQLDFDTLAVVFFLRFLISTFGHMAFGGIMGYELTGALTDPLNRSARLWRAFLLPWAVHGLFDFLLSIRLSAYTVLFLLLPLLYLSSLYRDPRAQERFRLHGRRLRAPIRGRPHPLHVWRRPPIEALPSMPWCPTCLATLDEKALQCVVCGTRFHRKAAVPVLPFRMLSTHQ